MMLSANNLRRIILALALVALLLALLSASIESRPSNAMEPMERVIYDDDGDVMMEDAFEIEPSQTAGGGIDLNEAGTGDNLFLKL